MVSASFVSNLASLPFLAQLQQKVALIRWIIKENSSFVDEIFMKLIHVVQVITWFSHERNSLASFML